MDLLLGVGNLYIQAQGDDFEDEILGDILKR